MRLKTVYDFDRRGGNKIKCQFCHQLEEENNETKKKQRQQNK